MKKGITIRSTARKVRIPKIFSLLPGAKSKTTTNVIIPRKIKTTIRLLNY